MQLTRLFVTVCFAFRKKEKEKKRVKNPLGRLGYSCTVDCRLSNIPGLNTQISSPSLLKINVLSNSCQPGLEFNAVRFLQVHTDHVLQPSPELIPIVFYKLFLRHFNADRVLFRFREAIERQPKCWKAVTPEKHTGEECFCFVVFHDHKLRKSDSAPAQPTSIVIKTPTTATHWRSQFRKVGAAPVLGTCSVSFVLLPMLCSLLHLILSWQLAASETELSLLPWHLFFSDGRQHNSRERSYHATLIIESNWK